VVSGRDEVERAKSLRCFKCTLRNLSERYLAFTLLSVFASSVHELGE
jgi:hypothetical protein